MTAPIDYSADYTDSYLAQLKRAIAASQELGLNRPRYTSDGQVVSDEVLIQAKEIVETVSIDFSRAIPDYWGNSCQTLSTYVFAELNAAGIPADIVIGNVIINGDIGFGATHDTLKAEWGAADRLEGDQSLHAWVSLGGDTIVDLAITPRLVHRYGAPSEWEDRLLIGRAAVASAYYRLHYQPMLVGTDFLAKTNTVDPMTVLEAVRRLHASSGR